MERLLEPHLDVGIVLSTSWVRERSYNYARRQLPGSLYQRVIGATYERGRHDLYSHRVTPRGVQILADVHHRKPAAWFAIDNDAEDWPKQIRHRLILTNGATGLSDPAVQVAVQKMLQSL